MNVKTIINVQRTLRKLTNTLLKLSLDIFVQIYLFYCTEELRATTSKFRLF